MAIKRYLSVECCKKHLMPLKKEFDPKKPHIRLNKKHYSSSINNWLNIFGKKNVKITYPTTSKFGILFFTK